MAEKEGTIHLERYTGDAKQVVAGAQQIADERQHAEVATLHLLVRLGVAYVSPHLLDLLGRAEREATRDKSAGVGIEHLLHALTQEIRGPAGVSS